MAHDHNDPAFVKMVADYLEGGLLDNTAAMLRHDPTLYPMVADLIQDERLRVRMGAIALVEELAEEGGRGLDILADAVAPLLADDSPTIRGDAAHAVGLVGSADHLRLLRPLLEDDHPSVRELAEDAVAAISQRRGS